jgi:hypothetical protein
MKEHEPEGKLIEVEDEKQSKYLEISDEKMYRNIDNELNLPLADVLVNDETHGIIYEGFGNCLVKIEELVKKIETSDLLAYQYKSDPKFNNRSKLRPTEVGRILVPYFSAMVDCFETDFKYSEHVDVFFNALNHIRSQTRNNILPPPTPQFFNELVVGIRNQLSLPDFKRRIAVRNHNVVRNFRSVQELVDSLFLKYSKILVLRIDLAYKKDARDGISIVDASMHREQFLNKARNNSIFKHKVGHIWKLEYGKDEKHHFHFAFFFDGSKVQSDWHLGNKIGKYWAKITKGTGTYHICIKTKYKRPGVGMIEHNDFPMRDNLMYTLAYLVKKDQFLRKKISDKAKSFSTTLKPKARTHSRGRKRKSLNEAPGVS